MSSLKRKAASLVLAGAISIGSAAVAMAATAYPAQGGRWDYGLSGTTYFSNYWHPSANHGSSVIVNGVLNRSACSAPNVTSTASRFAWPWYSRSAYYRIC